MTLLDAIVLGILQGVTEFLPISSSGHLVLGQYLLGLREPSLLFDIVLHVGTLVAVVAVYRRDVADVVTGVTESVRASFGGSRGVLDPEGARLALLVAIASIPTALIGLVVDRYWPIERKGIIAVVAVCAALLVNGCVLMASRWTDERPETRRGDGMLWNVTPTIALVLGCAQGVAVIPGLSRSGLTIVTALLLGVWRERAARLSFLMSIPAILGALALKFDPAVFADASWTTAVAHYGTGFAVSAGVGYAAILWLERLVSRAVFHHFSWYCWTVGAAGLLAIFAMSPV